jgi:hypothetical protein
VVLPGNKQVAQFLARNSRKRAKRLGIPHSISWEDIEIPSHCPITGQELVRNLGQQQDNSYTLDRVDASKGYVPGNVKVLSLRANRAKSDLTIDQLEKLIKYMKGN